MSTSGSTNWTLNRDQVITGALRKLGVLPSGGTPTTNQTSDASIALNALIKTLQADGMPVWKMTTVSFTTTAGTSSYNIGVGQTLNYPRPLSVVQAWYAPSGSNNTPMTVYNRYDYQILPNSAQGTPINLYYQQLRATGTIKLWPTPADSTTTITVDYQSLYEDMNSATDDFDFPPYWIQPLIYLLAWTLSPEYGISPMDREELKKDALYWKDQALALSGETESLFLQPNFEG